MTLENAFKEACERHEHLKLLESQWRFDKELISKALQNISSIFPHYSRHDSSHSKQIIINIERMLGDRIHHLTATDMWLLLEAAYSHDIGMVVTHKQIQDMDTPEFKAFIQDIAERPEHDLYSFSVNWLEGKATLPNGSSAHIFFDEYRQLLAEWYRRKHPENAAKVISSPLDEIGLTSPRNELLPKRLFGVLGAICYAHGQPFEKVLELPFSEAGMATEDCHPRYVAFLLRMGDLLDVDDNRFCPVMMKMSGASLPAHSHAHLEKHRGIKHFRLDSERIKIEVVCPSPESYEVAHEWFTWLEKEYHCQSQHWPKIVPNEKLGRLPTLAPPKVTLNEPYLIINEGKKPKFNLNQDAILKLLRGTGLYTSKMDSIREILQNAVDSTIIAIWEKHKDLIVKLDPSSEELFEIYDDSMIVVDFLQNQQDLKLFTLIVKDKGIGISKNDLEHMLEVGSSNKSRKSKIIREMPNWFKPSGNFGIGLQSIFLLSEKFTITTKSRFTQEAFRLTFNYGKGSSVLIERLPSEGTDYGATIAVDIKFEDFPRSISYSLSSERSELLRRMNEYDFTQPNSDLKVYEQFRVFEAIKEFNKGSPIKINSIQHPLPSSRSDAFFSQITNITLTNVRFGYSDHTYLVTRFRGQEFSELNLNTPLVSATADFYGHQAIDFLTYNREKILPEAKPLASKEVTLTLIEYIDRNFNAMNDKEKPCAAAFYFLNSEQNKDRYFNDLLKYQIMIEGSEHSLSLAEVLKNIDSSLFQDFAIREPNVKVYQQNPPPTHPIPPTVKVLSGDAKCTTLLLIKVLMTKNGKFWQELLPVTGQSEVCHFSKDDILPVSNDVLKKIFSGEKRFFEIGKRMFFPAWGKYRKLAVKADTPWARIHRHAGYYSDYLVLPYTFDHNNSRQINTNDDLVTWVYHHLKNDGLTIEEVRTLYTDLITEIETIFSEAEPQ